MGTIGISERIKNFLNKYKEYLADNDISGLLIRGRGELKPYNYNELLLVLHNANISLQPDDIFAPLFDYKKVMWGDNNDILKDFYFNNSLEITLDFPELQYITVGSFLDYLSKLQASGENIEIFSNSKNREYHLISNAKIYKYWQEDLNQIYTQLIIKDNHGNGIHIINPGIIGNFYDGVGYGWNSKRFKEQADYLIELINSI